MYFQLHAGQFLQRAGVWIPAHCTLTKSDPLQTRELSLQWESVNEEPPRELFYLSGMDIPDKTLVVNEKLGESVVEGTVAEPAEARRLLEEAEDGSRESLVRRRVLIVTVNCVALMAIILVFVLKRRAHRSR